MTLRSLLLLPALAAALVLSACGGSSSETPWPAPPTTPPPGPEGESTDSAGSDDTGVTNEREDPAGAAGETEAGEKRERPPLSTRR
jgi:ABC-type glycerol-3-phosphate transport system substrate-binding protein